MTKVPTDVGGRYFMTQLRKLGYEKAHRKGSHQVMTTQQDGENHVSVPDHNPIAVGTLRSILNDLGTIS